LPFALLYTPEAQQQYEFLGNSKNLSKRFKAVKEALRFLGEDPSHPSLHTHKYNSLLGPEGVDVFEAYAENKTASAYRIFWCYYPPKVKGDALGSITILAITPHP
jgi:hypothetical protein